MRVIDNEGTVVSKSFSIVINTPSLAITTGAALPSGSVGVGYSQRFSVVGGTAPYTWSLISGSVPGLAFDAAQATLSGTPSTPGPFSFSLQARDSRGLTATRSFTIEIAPAPLIITTGAELPGRWPGASYSVQMSATGGVLPYTWSANGLPDGLTIDADTGAITGTLNAAGAISFTIRVIDSARATAVGLFRMNVGLPPLPAVSITGLPAIAGPAQQYALQIAIAQPFPVLVTGQAILTFSPDAGGGDGTIQFSTGGSDGKFQHSDRLHQRVISSSTGHPDGHRCRHDHGFPETSGGRARHHTLTCSGSYDAHRSGGAVAFRAPASSAMQPDSALKSPASRPPAK